MLHFQHINYFENERGGEGEGGREGERGREKIKCNYKMAELSDFWLMALNYAIQ